MKIKLSELKKIIAEQIKLTKKNQEINIDDFHKNIYPTFKNKNAIINMLVNHVPVLQEIAGKFDSNLDFKLKGGGNIIIPYVPTAHKIEKLSDIVYAINFSDNVKFVIILK